MLSCLPDVCRVALLAAGLTLSAAAHADKRESAPTTQALALESPAAAVAPTPAPAVNEKTPVPAAPKAVPLPSTPAPVPAGKAWLLLDFATHRVLAGESIDEKLEPASLTKIMTSYLVSRALADGKVKRDDEVIISENAWRGGGGGTDGSTSFLPLGKAAKLDDLLRGMIVQSGNDASIALAEHVAGSEPAFAELMNSQAKQLGMTASHFENSHGLHAEGHVSTAQDMATLSAALIRDFPEDYAVYKEKELTINGITQHNRNLLLWRDPSVDGIKTGHHSQAGYNLVASALRGDMRLISVVLGSTSEKQRAADTKALLEWGFRTFETHTVFPAGKVVASSIVWKSPVDEVPVGLAEALLVTIPAGRYGDVAASVELPDPLLAPVAKGDKLGHLTLQLDGAELAKRELIALEDAPLDGFFGRSIDALKLWWESD